MHVHPIVGIVLKLSVLLAIGLVCLYLYASDKAPDCYSPDAWHITAKALLDNATKRVAPTIPSGFGCIIQHTRYNLFAGVG